MRSGLVPGEWKPGTDTPFGHSSYVLHVPSGYWSEFSNETVKIWRQNKYMFVFTLGIP